MFIVVEIRMMEEKSPLLTLMMMKEEAVLDGREAEESKSCRWYSDAYALLIICMFVSKKPLFDVKSP